MGAWGAGAFDNDYAMDWVAELVEAEDESEIEGAFDLIPGPGDFLDSPEASIALAAAEVVAVASGAPGPRVPSEAMQWALAHQAVVTAALILKAQEAVKRVAEESELRQLWEESGSLAEWQRAVSDLQGRLASLS